MKLRTNLTILFFLLLVSNTQAVEIIPMPLIKATLWERVSQAISSCKLNLKCYFEPKLGVSVTTISGSTLISSYPTIQNANVNALNDGKIENSTTSIASITTLSNLVTVGTLTSGSLGSGFTTVVVARGGTGSTTLSSNQVMLGNGTGIVKTVQGWGTSGQLLTSGGAGAVPTWESASFDVSANYILTGQWKFLGGATTTLLTASSTPTNPIVLNTVSYNTPSTQGASSTSLVNDGSGNLKHQVPDLLLITTVRATGTVASLVAENLPIGEFLYVVLETTGQSSANTIDIQFNGDETATNYFQRGYENFSLITSDAGAGGGGGTIIAATTTPLTLVFNIKNFANANKLYSFSGVGNVTQISGQGKWTDTSNAITKLKLFQAGGAGNGFLAGTVLKVYKSNN